MELHPDFAKQVYQEAGEKENLSKEKTIFIYLKDFLDRRLKLLEFSFPKSTFHTVAIKTMAQHEVLKHIAQKGFGLEAASYEEVLLAKSAGASNDHIVFDSPVKTREEIKWCHQKFPGITVNANSLEELKRYPDDFSGKIGLRINPLEKSDAPAIFNLSASNSKFGVPITQKKEIISSCIQYSIITGLHVHIGSGIQDFRNNVNAVRKLKLLADEINAERKRRNIDNFIEFIDIGGGIHFNDDKPESSVGAFVEQLSKIDGLFENYKTITEYGNFVHKNNGFVVSDIEYVVPRPSPEPSLVFIHVGADLFVRKVYSGLPIDYPVHVLKKENNVEKKKDNYRIVGPLCFEGDVLYENVELAVLEEGDKLLILNTGANTISMWSRHCNRNIPKFVFF